MVNQQVIDLTADDDQLVEPAPPSIFVPTKVSVTVPIGQKLVDCHDGMHYVQCMSCDQQYCFFIGEGDNPVKRLSRCPAWVDAICSGSQPPHPVLPDRDSNTLDVRMDPFDYEEGDVCVLNLVTGELHVRRDVDACVVDGKIELR